MKSFNAVSEKSKKKSTVKCGDFESTVVSVETPQDFVEGEAFDITYDLVDENGTHHSYRERFYADTSNERTATFADYLDNIGVGRENIENFVGTKEKISIRKKVSKNQARPTIVSREVIK